MTKRLIVILVVLLVLAGIVTVEQVYTDTSIDSMLTEIALLETQIDEENLEASTALAEQVVEKWNNYERIICLFVDFRDIEQIGRQTDLVLSHLQNEDFELARVECNTLERVVKTFKNMIQFDWQNII